MRRAKSGHFCIQPDTPTPRRRASPKQRSLSLGELEPKVDALSSPPRRSSASPRRSIATPRRTCKSCFGSSLSLILPIIHWINEDPNR